MRSGRWRASTSREARPPARAAEALNAGLPDDVAVVAADEAPADFHARHSAGSRTYRYRICGRRAPLAVRGAPQLVDAASARLERAERVGALLVGEHDFRAFTPTETQHEVFAANRRCGRWDERGEQLELEIEADSFLRHMVRTLVGTMLDQEPGPEIDGAARAGRPRDGGPARTRAAVRASYLEQRVGVLTATPVQGLTPDTATGDATEHRR